MSDDLSKLNLVELLDLLEPIPEPAPVSLWPQTAGWIGLAIALLLLLAWATRRWWLQRRANAYRRAALAEIAASGQDPVALAEILRRTALVAFPRAEVASLHGEAWLAFLDRSYGGNDFSTGPGRVVALLPYAQVADVPELVPLVAEWVHRHCRHEESTP